MDAERPSIHLAQAISSPNVGYVFFFIEAMLMRLFLTILLCVCSNLAVAKDAATTPMSSFEARAQLAKLYALILETKIELKIENGDRLKQDPKTLFRAASLLLEGANKFQRNRALELRNSSDVAILEGRFFDRYSSCANAATKLTDFISYSAITDIKISRLSEMYSQFESELAECKRVRTPKLYHSGRSVRF